MATDSYLRNFLFGLALYLIFSVEALYREPLFTFSLDFIYTIQQLTIDIPVVKQFFLFITDLGAEVIIGSTILFSYLLLSRERALYYILNIFVMSHVSSVLKLAYHGPRPYWASDDILAYKCSSDYGSPSGHSSVSMHTTVFILLDVLST